MNTYIRDYGDGKKIVLYTEEDALYQQLKEWDSCLMVVFYEQWPYWDPRNAIIVGVDLYFPKEVREEVRKAAGLPKGKHTHKGKGGRGHEVVAKVFELGGGKPPPKRPYG